VTEAPTAPVGRLTKLLAACLPLGMIAWATDVLRLVGLQVYPESFAAAILGIGLLLVFLHVSAKTGRQRLAPVPWYDLVLAALGFGVCLYISVTFPEFSIAAFKSPGALTAAFVLLPLLLEGARRTAGLPIVIMAVAFLVIGLTAYLMPGDLEGRNVSTESLVYYLTWNPTAILGTPLMVVVTTVVAFILFGQALTKSGGSEFFTELAIALMGRFRGGQAKVAIIASALFGTISGSVVANVASTGVITIPMMKRAGYRPHVAGAIEAVAGTGGQLMPPVMGISAFLIAEYLQVPYATVALSALIPAAIYFAALFIQVDLEAARHAIVRVPKADIPPAAIVLKAGWVVALPFTILIVGMFWLHLPIELAAIYATLAALLSGIVFGYRGKRLRPRDSFAVLASTGFGILDILMIAPLAGLVIGVLNVTGLGFTLALSLISLAAGSALLLLIMTGIVSIILGMGMPTVGVYILLAALVAPALINAGIDPMAAHLFIFYYGMLSMITPPVAFGAFTAAAIAGSSPMQTAFASMRFGWTAFVLPFLFVFSPSLLFRAAPVITLIDVSKAVLAVWLISVAFVGYSTRILEARRRVAYAVAGVAMLPPIGILPWSHIANVAGFAIGIALFVFDRTQKKRGLPAG